MAGALDLSVVVPAFNEASIIQRSIRELLETLPALTNSFEVLVVDDGSRDDTAAIVEALSLKESRVLLQRERHKGKGAAVRSGMLRASGGLRFMCDADLSMHPSQITRFMAIVPQKCDVAIATRESRGARRIGEPGYRHAMGRIFNGLIRATTLSDVQDTQCGFKMFSAQAARLIFERATIDGWAFDVEALYIARLHGLHIAEVPVEWYYRNQSHVSALRDTFRMLRELHRIRRNARAGIYSPK